MWKCMYSYRKIPCLKKKTMVRQWTRKSECWLSHLHIFLFLFLTHWTWRLLLPKSQAMTLSQTRGSREFIKKADGQVRRFRNGNLWVSRVDGFVDSEGKWLGWCGPDMGRTVWPEGKQTREWWLEFHEEQWPEFQEGIKHKRMHLLLKEQLERRQLEFILACLER